MTIAKGFTKNSGGDERLLLNEKFMKIIREAHDGGELSVKLPNGDEVHFSKDRTIV